MGGTLQAHIIYELQHFIHGIHSIHIIHRLYRQLGLVGQIMCHGSENVPQVVYFMCKGEKSKGKWSKGEIERSSDFITQMGAEIRFGLAMSVDWQPAGVGSIGHR
jgi:hypothetical protein